MPTPWQFERTFKFGGFAQMARKKKELTGNTYEVLLDAAVEVFSKKGYSSTTFHEIALVAGLTRGAIYWHFTDKKQLLEAALKRDPLPWINLPESFDSLQCTPSLADLCEVLRQGVEEVIVKPRLQRVIYIFLRCSEPVITSEPAYLQFVAAFERLKIHIEAALKQHYPDADASIQAAAASVKALMVGALYCWLEDKDGINLRQVPLTAKAIIQSFLGRPGVVSAATYQPPISQPPSASCNQVPA